MIKSLVPVALAACLLPCVARAGVNPSNFDTSVKPQDDFYHYADGGWLKNNPIPPAYSRWGAFDELIQRNQENLRTLCERASAVDTGGSPPERMVGAFYASGMDEDAIDAAGAAPLEFEFQRIAALKTSADVLDEIAHLQTIGVSAGFDYGSETDIRNSDYDIAVVSQGGLGLPDRDYYFRDDADSKKLRDQYVAHVAAMLRLLGDAPDVAQSEAAAVMKLETTLAGASLTKVILRNPQASYHKMTVDKAEALAPGIDLKRFFTETGAPSFDTFNFAHPDFFKAFGAALSQTPVSDWQAYLRWQVINTFAPYLSHDFVNEDFAFYGATLSGTKELKPRWKRVVTTIDGSIGETLGQLYTAAYFPPESKGRALDLVHHLEDALRDRLKTLPWMDEPTRERALAKLDALSVKIGYPDKWRDYSGLVIDRGPYVLNVLKSDAFEFRRQLKKIGKPVDRTEWEMTPPTVNAYYNPTQNEIVFPAGILQPPFFDSSADDAVNYGGIGAVIGHEMTHGYDDVGRQFDPKGNLSDWWTPESADQFKARSAAIVKQFNAYFVFPDLHVNGELTEGENIADLGGIKLAYAALMKDLAGKPEEKIDGFTPEQRFFLSFASIWATNYRPQALRLQVNTNPHSPAEFRCNGPLSNLPEFAEAFDVPDGAPMRRPAADRVEIW